MMRELHYIATLLRRPIATAAIGLIVLLIGGQAGGVRAQETEEQKQQASSHERSIRIHAKPSSARLCVKSRKLIIPHINFRNLTVRECTDFLRVTSREQDKGNYGSPNGGLTFVVFLNEEEVQRAPRVNFDAENVAFLDAVEEVVRQTDLDYRIASYTPFRLSTTLGFGEG